MTNLSSYCELVDAKIRASDKDLPVPATYLDCLWIQAPKTVGKVAWFIWKRSASGTNELKRMNEDSRGRRIQIDEDGKIVHEP